MIEKWPIQNILIMIVILFEDISHVLSIVISIQWFLFHLITITLVTLMSKGVLHPELIIRSLNI